MRPGPLQASFELLIASGALTEVCVTSVQSLREFGNQINLGRTSALSHRPAFKSERAVAAVLRAAFRRGGRRAMFSRSVSVVPDASCLAGTGDVVVHPGPYGSQPWLSGLA